MAERTRTRRRFSLGVFFSPQSIWYSHVYTQHWKPLPRAEARMLLRPLKQPWLTGHSATQTWPAARTVTHWCQTCLSIQCAAHVGFDTMHRRSPPQCFSSRFEPAERGWVFCHLVPWCWCQYPEAGSGSQAPDALCGQTAAGEKAANTQRMPLMPLAFFGTPQLWLFAISSWSNTCFPATEIVCGQWQEEAFLFLVSWSLEMAEDKSWWWRCSLPSPCLHSCSLLWCHLAAAWATLQVQVYPTSILRSKFAQPGLGSPGCSVTRRLVSNSSSIFAFCWGEKMESKSDRAQTSRAGLGHKA